MYRPRIGLQAAVGALLSRASVLATSGGPKLFVTPLEVQQLAASFTFNSRFLPVRGRRHKTGGRAEARAAIKRRNVAREKARG